MLIRDRLILGKKLIVTSISMTSIVLFVVLDLAIGVQEISFHDLPLTFILRTLVVLHIAIESFMKVNVLAPNLLAHYVILIQLWLG